MYRLIIEDLNNWKAKKSRKPLIIRGARQVGKTWIVEEFGKSYNNFVHIDFDRQIEYCDLFKNTKDPARLIQNIQFIEGKQIDNTTLLFFDEIQACQEALNSLKYFYEEKPEINIIGAGSLLGIQLSQGFPVGKVEFIDLHPLSFFEFLIADNHKNLHDYLKSINQIENIPDLFSGPLNELLQMYYLIGGMPEVVENWIECHDINQAIIIQDNIINSYRGDFGKHSHSFDVPKINLIWNSLPAQLSKENKKFLYNVIKKGARAREYENALNWLFDANLLNRVSKITKPGFPISAYEDRSAFKVYMEDVGLLSRHANIPHQVLLNKHNLYSEFKGSLTENYVLQSLLSTKSANEKSIYYWANNNYEVDFVYQFEDMIVPIEVKSSANINSTSLKNYLKIYENNTNFGVRFSTKNLSFDGNILNVPLFLAEELPRLLKYAGLRK